MRQVMGPLMGMSARFLTRSVLTNVPLPLLGCLAPCCSQQGASYPTKENVRKEVGEMQDLPGLLLKAAYDRKVMVILPSPAGPARASKELQIFLELSEIKRVQPAVVFWNNMQLETKYRGSAASKFIGSEQLFDTHYDWSVQVLGVEPNKASVLLAQASLFQPELADVVLVPAAPDAGSPPTARLPPACAARLDGTVFV